MRTRANCSECALPLLCVSDSDAGISGAAVSVSPTDCHIATIVMAIGTDAIDGVAPSILRESHVLAAERIDRNCCQVDGNQRLQITWKELAVIAPVALNRDRYSHRAIHCQR